MQHYICVYDFQQKLHKITTFEYLEPLLNQRLDNNCSSFCLTHGVEDFPALSLLFNGDYAYAYYFPSVGQTGFHSVGNLKEFDKVNLMPFLEGEGNEVEVVGYAILRFSSALDVAREFFSSPQLPKCIEWCEL